MSSEDLENLHKIWTQFLETKNTKEGERWLDTFLAKYLILFCYNKIPPGHEYSLQHRFSAQVLVHQLLVDVYELCDKSVDEISTGCFEDYLLKGRGWKILWTVDKMGVQHLMHLKELIVCLTTQVPILLKLPVHSSVLPDCLERKPERLDLNSCFFSSNGTSTSKNIDFRKPEIYAPLKKIFKRKKRVHRKRAKQKSESGSSSSEEQDIMLESCYIPAVQVKSLLKAKANTNNDSSSSERDEYSQNFFGSNTPVISSNVTDFQSYYVSVIDYIGFNFNMIQECVFLDSKFHDINRCVSILVLEFSFRLLKDIYSDKYKFFDWPKESVEDLKIRLLELLFLSSSVARISFGYDEMPSSIEIISTLFIIAEKVINSSHECSLSPKDIMFVSHILKGCLMMMHNIIETCDENYAKIICIIRTFSDYGANICHFMFSLLEKQMSDQYEKDLKTFIALLRDIIISLKFLRLFATYSSDDICNVNDHIHHHNDIFGPPMSHNILNQDYMCSVAAISCSLLKMFSESLHPKTSNDILKYLKMSGICCCVNPSFLWKSLFDSYSTRDSETQKFILVTLTKHLFPQLGLVLKCQKRCNHCSKYLNTSEFLPLDRASDYINPVDSVQFLHPNVETLNSFDLIFKIYNDLLNVSDHETLENVSRHLMEVFTICVSELKMQIFIRVILPQFLHLNINPGELLSSLVSLKVKCFLSVFPLILSNTALYCMFLKLQGIQCVFPFLLNAELRDLTLDVIKILIYSENECRNNISCEYSEISVFPASRTFCSFLSHHTDNFIQKLNLVFKLSSDFTGLLMSDDELDSLKFDEPTFTVIEECSENVSFICDMWNLFKELVLNAKLNVFNSFYDEVLTSGYNLLILLLKNLSVVLRIKAVIENQKTEKILLLMQGLISVLVNQKKEVHKQSVLYVVKCNLKIHAPKCVKYHKMLFCLILKCCFRSYTITTPVKKLNQSTYLESEILDSMSSERDETEILANKEGYAADTEGSSDNAEVEVKKDGFLAENFIEHGEFVKMLCELVADLQTENSSEWIPTALYFMQILIKLCQDCFQNKSILCHQDIPPLLLDIFSNSLVMSHVNVKEFQTVTMDLFVILTESEMKTSYIKRMIEFFKTAHPPVDILLKSFNQMVDQIVPNAASYVTFPCIEKKNASYLRVKKRLKAIYSAHKQFEFVESIPSAWTSSALFFPLTEDTKWNALNKGFSLTLWLKLNRSCDVHQSVSRDNSSELKNGSSVFMDSYQKSHLLHILSLGSDKFLIEFWFGKYKGDLVIRISSYINGEVLCLSEGKCKLFFQFNVWHHVAITYSEETEKSLFTSKFHVILDGVKEKICTLKYKRTGIKSLNKCHLLLGYSVPVLDKTPSVTYSIANFCLFKDNVLTKDVLYYLSSHGPDISAITKCAIEKPVKFVLKNNMHNLVSPSDLDIVTGNKIPNLDNLQNSVLCSFTAENPDIYLVYPAASPGFFPLHFPVRGKSRFTSFDDWPFQKQPVELPSLSVVTVCSNQCNGFEHAVQTAGGIRIFLFLFANVLEYFSSESNISGALSIILKLLNKSTTFLEDFTRIKGYELLVQMISNTKCCISSEFLQVFIQNCMIYVIPGNQILLNCQPPKNENLTVIRNTSIFNLMFKSLAFSPQSPPSVTTGLFSVLDLLLNPKHSNLNINVEQLMSIQMLDVLIWLLKRNIILFDKNYLPPAVIKMIPIIIENLLIYKFDLKVLQNIMCMLLMLHNASSTYVCHSPSSFYFLTFKEKSNVSSLIKTLNVPVENETEDAASCTQTFKFQRSSSFSGTSDTSVEKELQKSMSLDHLSPDLFSKDCESKGKSEAFNIFACNTTDKLNTFVFKSKGSAVESNSDQNKSAELTNGLLKVILNFIMSENNSHSEAALEIIKPEIFIVLAYTKNPEICASVIKVINMYLKADENKQNEFLRVKGFHLLANQLYQLPADPEVIDACFCIIFDCPLQAVDMNSVYTNNNVSSFQIVSWIPVLALLPNTYSDEKICEKIITTLSKFLHLGTNVTVELLENGAVVSLINLILKFCVSTDVEFCEEMLEKYPSIKKVSQLLKYIAQDLCSSRSTKGFNLLIDSLQLFSAWERKCHNKYGPKSISVTCLRNFQCIMFEVVVEFSELYSLPQEESQKIIDETSLWNVVVGIQGTYGSFSSMSVPQTVMVNPSRIHGAVEAEELDRPLSAEAEKCVNEVPINDVIDRFLLLIEISADFFVFKDHSIRIGSIEKEFYKTFCKFIIENLTLTLDKNFKLNKSKNSAVLFALRDTFKKQLGRILVSSLAPSQDVHIKKTLIEILYAYPHVAKVFQFVVHSITKAGAFLIFLYDLQTDVELNLQKQCRLLFNIVKQLLSDSQCITLLYSKDSMEKAKISWMSLWSEDRCKWLSSCDKKHEKAFEKLEFLAQDVSTMALYVTQQVFEIQNLERKMLIEELKIKSYEEACERMIWFELCEQMTHERAIWHMKDYYPFSWEMDPTEGPARIRRRLRRCHIQMNPRFFQPDHADALNNLKKGSPFVTLLTQQNEYLDSAAVLNRLFQDEQIKFTCPCMIVSAFEEIAVEILIGAYCIHIIGENKSEHAKSPISESWTFESIKEIIPRRHELLNNAFEIFLTNGNTYMISFQSEKDFNIVWKQLENLGLPCEANKDPLVITQLWRDGSITNYEYLVHLNKLSGRTFNDLMQYPVFPFILADYGSFFLNLDDPASYRNLAKPIAVQLQRKEEHYRNTYQMLSEQAEFDSSLPYIGPYHYGSHYSNSGTVLHYLIRLLPYTYGFISYQDRNFDCADRTFHNLATSWELVTEKSSSDVKELIPEFFFLPEFLCNKNGFDFGITQSGIRVNDVILPPWCKQNARLFILIHRQALESEFITNNLHGWIDLIFGYKQTGEAAVNAVNVFHPSTYYGVDRNKYSDPVKRDAFRTMIRTLGNTPQQLFFSPHPMVSLTLSGFDIADEKKGQMEVIDTVQGLRWGNYVGSPTSGTPSLVWCRKQNIILGSFLPLLTNYVFGLGENVCLLLNHKKDMGSGISRDTYIMSAALVSWNHKDGVVRIKLCRDQPSLPLLRGNSIDPICLCASVPDCKYLFVAHSSGIINAFDLELNASELSIKERRPRVQLNGHSEAIKSIYICKAFSIVASASSDKTIIIWDLNKLCYVRTILCDEGAITLVCVSDTLGDVAFVCNVENDAGSLLKVHTINGEAVGTIHIEQKVTALCYSTAPEGLSVNVIATGLSNGVINLSFSADNQHLYASNEDGTVTVWEKPSRGLTSVPRLLVFT